MRSGKSPLESQRRYDNETDLVVTKCLICYDFFLKKINEMLPVIYRE